jgi:amidohydrolase
VAPGGAAIVAAAGAHGRGRSLGHESREGMAELQERRDERAQLLAAVDREADDALTLAHWMSEHPELSLAEHQTSARYIAFLGARGFGIDTPVAGLDTAFVARHGAGTAPLAAGLLAEMDALPEIGHACGHNLSGPASLLAAAALADTLPEAAVQLVVVGTPAEETGVGKRALVAAGVFDELDCAMMAHASDMRRAHRLFLGNEKFEFVYHGVAAHAAAYPHDGINALDGVIAFFVALGLLRQQLPSGVRVHGVITDGGQAPNVIPERAAARVWVRALEPDVLAAAARRVRDCAEGAAAATGTRLAVVAEPDTSPPMRANLPLAEVYRRQLGVLGLEETSHAPDEAIGSSDITHVAQVVPTIHPNFPIGTGLQLHTRAFAAATRSDAGRAGLLEAARALALTVWQLARSPAAREAVARAWRESES